MAFLDTYNKAWLVARYLPGIPLTDPTGTALPDSFFTEQLATALAWLESTFNIVVDPVTVTDEKHDDTRLRYGPPNSAPFDLRVRPVRTLTALSGKWGNNSQVEYPVDWCLKCGKESPEPDLTGQVELIPTPEGMATLNSYTALAIGQYGVAPCWWRWSYTAGWALATDVPAEIPAMVGLYASIQILAYVGSYIGGLGVTSESGGQDGLNTSVSYAKSGTNHALVGLSEANQKRLDGMVAQFAGKYRRPRTMIL